MKTAQPKKSHKIAFPLIIAFALIGSIVGGLTGITVLYAIGMVGFIIALAAASIAAWRERKKHGDDASGHA